MRPRANRQQQATGNIAATYNQSQQRPAGSALVLGVGEDVGERVLAEGAEQLVEHLHHRREHVQLQHGLPADVVVHDGHVQRVLHHQISSYQTQSALQVVGVQGGPAVGAPGAREHGGGEAEGGDEHADGLEGEHVEEGVERHEEAEEEHLLQPRRHGQEVLQVLGAGAVRDLAAEAEQLQLDVLQRVEVVHRTPQLLILLGYSRDVPAGVH